MSSAYLIKLTLKMEFAETMPNKLTHFSKSAREKLNFLNVRRLTLLFTIKFN